MENFYKFTEEDLKEVLNFVRDYHLNPTKGSRGRTNQGKRSFGGELDEFIPGKLIEIAVCRILEKYNNKIKLFPDFKIYSNKIVGEMSDPDITIVKEEPNLNERKPKVFVEIKRYDPGARWMGPRKHQLKDMEEGYMVHASIEFDDKSGKKQRDITASILKKIVKPDLMNLDEFANFNDLIAEIKYVYSFKDVKDKGHYFESGNIIPDTDFPKARSAYKKDGSMGKTYNLLNTYEGEKKLKMRWESKSNSLSYGDWIVTGKFQILRDKKGKEFIYALNNVKMESKVFGLFNLKKFETYRFYFTNTLGKKSGKDVFKSIDDYWFSKKRLDELLKTNEIIDPLSAIKQIANEI